MNIIHYFIFFGILCCFGIQNFEIEGSEMPIDQHEMNRFIDVIKIIKKNYISNIDEKKIVNDAIKGILSGLDSHSAYYTKDEYIDSIDKTNGVYGGIGIEVSLVNGNLKIIGISKNSSAEINGLQIGDTINEIDGKKITGLTITDVKNLMRGETDTNVNIAVLREPNTYGEVEQNLNFTLTRTIIKIENLETHRVQSNTLYIKINRFSENTFDDLQEAIKNNHEIKGVILDLRNNGGGLLEQAIKVSDAFLPNGEIISIKNKNSNNNIKKYNSSGSNLIDPKIPMVLLINTYSASASEIVAAALKDNKRAVLVGKTTFGKGSVQNIISLQNKDAIKLTTALFYRPNGEMIHEKGVEPNIEVDDLIINGVKENADIQSEAALERKSKHIIVGNDKLPESNQMIDDEENDIQLYIAKQVINYQLSLAKK